MITPGTALAQAPAKINLYLHVTGKRADGYHLLDSLIAFAGIGDSVEARPAEQITLSCDGPFGTALANEPDNLVLRAAHLLAARAGISSGAALRLTKRLPIASGIGGGSADAAASLRALAQLWNLVLPDDVLHAIAAQLGADVPICLHGRAATISGIGEIIEAAPPLPDAGIVLVNPGKALSTPAVFKNFRGPMSAAHRLERSPRDTRDLCEMLAARGNDLTDAAISLVPEIADTLAALARTPGTLLARMSGSGATCFALFEDAPGAVRAAEKIAADHPNWWVRGASLLKAESKS